MLASGGINLSALEAIVIILGGLLGSGGVVALVKGLRASGRHDDRLDRAANAVLGTKDDGSDSLENRLAVRLDRRITEEASKIRRELTQNGGENRQLGATVERIEKKVDLATANLQRHIGRCDERDRIVERRLSDIERDCPLLNPGKMGGA